jgi:uncharacterized protein
MLLLRRWLLPMLVFPALTGCMSAVRNAVRARSVAYTSTGLSVSDDALRQLLRTGAAEIAADALVTRAAPRRVSDVLTTSLVSTSGDRLLDALTMSATAFYAGRYTASSEAAWIAQRGVEQQITRSLTREATAMLTNDLARGYRPSATEVTMLPWYALLSYVAKGDLEGAQVEARRIAQRLEETSGTSSAESRSLQASLRLLTAVVFEAAGEWNDADVARRHVVQLTGDSSFTPRLRTAASADSVDVLVVVEEGFAPHRVAQTAVFGGDHGNNTWDADGLTRSILDASAGDARGGAFGLGQWQGGGWLWGRRAGIDALAGDPGTTLAIAWPVLAGALGVATGPIRVDSMATGSLVIGDLGRSLEADYRRALPSIVGRVAARAVARQAALSAIRGKNGKRRTAAAVFAVAAAAIDLADTRSWSVLPARVGVLPIRVPSGARQIVISGGGRTTAVPLTLGGPRLRLAHWRLFDGESTPVAVASTGGTIATGLPR